MYVLKSKRSNIYWRTRNGRRDIFCDNAVYNYGEVMKLEDDRDMNEEFKCCYCGKPVTTRILYCSVECEKTQEINKNE